MSFNSGDQPEFAEVIVGEIVAKRRQERGFQTPAQLCEAAKKLEEEDATRFKAFSLSLLWAWERDVGGERIGKSNNKTLQTLAYLLGWSGEDFRMNIGFPIGIVPRIDHTSERSVFSFVERLRSQVQSFRPPPYFWKRGSWYRRF